MILFACFGRATARRILLTIDLAEKGWFYRACRFDAAFDTG